MVILGFYHVADLNFKVGRPVAVVEVVRLEQIFSEYQPGDKPDFPGIYFLFLRHISRDS